jgi:hypothetical protein
MYLDREFILWIYENEIALEIAIITAEEFLTQFSK